MNGKGLSEGYLLQKIELGVATKETIYDEQPAFRYLYSYHFPNPFLID